MRFLQLNCVVFFLQGSQCCPLWSHSANFPGCAPTSHTCTPSLVSLAWPPNMATAALVVPRGSGPLCSYLHWPPWKTLWSPHSPSCCPPWTHRLSGRREACWMEHLSTPTTHMLLCQMLNGGKRRGRMRKRRRRRRGRWPCCLLAGEAINHWCIPLLHISPMIGPIGTFRSYSQLQYGDCHFVEISIRF